MDVPDSELFKQIQRWQADMQAAIDAYDLAHPEDFVQAMTELDEQ